MLDVLQPCTHLYIVWASWGIFSECLLHLLCAHFCLLHGDASPSFLLMSVGVFLGEAKGMAMDGYGSMEREARCVEGDEKLRYF